MSVQQKVKELWGILDDMCQNNPQEYKRFIQSQLQQGADSFSPPQPLACVRTSLLKPLEGILYINICIWKCVPARKSATDPLCVFAGRVETVAEKKETIVDVAFNPEACQTEDLHLLAMTFIQKQHNLNLSESYRLTKQKIRGSVQDMTQRLSTPRPHSTAKSDAAPSLLKQISDLRLAEDPDSSVQLSIKEEKAARPGLIQVVSSTDAEPQQPRHLLTTHVGGNSAKKLQLSVDLPGVRSVSQCQLSVSPDHILLQVENLYYLHLDFPELVDEETCTAVFNKAHQTLTVTTSVMTCPAT